MYEDMIHEDIKFFKKCFPNGIELSSYQREPRSPLMLAAFNERLDIMDFLLETGFDIDFQNPSGVTALMMACHYNREKSFNYLINKNANINLKNIFAQSALMIAIKHEAFDRVKDLIILGAQIEREKLKIILPQAYEDYLELFDNIQLKRHLDSNISINPMLKKGFKI